MKLLPDRTEPPAFASICRAFHMAKHVPATGARHLHIGLADGDGVLVAEDFLDGHRQAEFLASHLQTLGYRERLLGQGEQMFGCDLVFVAPAEAPQLDPMPANTAAERWPLSGLARALAFPA